MESHPIAVKISGVEWDRANLAHFREHGRCARNEVEEVIQCRCYPTRGLALIREPGEEPRRLFYGRTCAGRHLAVVVAPQRSGIVRPITCWPLSRKAITRYEAWRRTVTR
jgi:hypothetical protein